LEEVHIQAYNPQQYGLKRRR